VQQLMRDLADWLYKQLKAEYDYRTSDVGSTRPWRPKTCWRKIWKTHDAAHLGQGGASGTR